MKTIIRVYRSKGWRWQMRDARNGRVIGASTEAYTRQAACLKNLERTTGIFMLPLPRNLDYDSIALLENRNMCWLP